MSWTTSPGSRPTTAPLSWMPASSSRPTMMRRWSFLLAIVLAQAITFDPVPPPSLDLANLGRVGLVGDFDAISLYQYRQQNQNAFNTNGSRSILAPMLNGAFATLASADADIEAMCPFVMKGGALAGIVVGGSFTSLGGVEAHGVAMLDPNTSRVTPLPGLTGKVSALLCDQSTETVYVGGEFKAGNSTNAIAWVGRSGWANLPFAGFNGPVFSIVKAPDGKILFGGSFAGLGNSSTNRTRPASTDEQIINLSSARISSGPATTATPVGFDDPRNIVCKTADPDGPGNTWLLPDHISSYWRADFRFGFRPTKLRLWNTRHDRRGTKTFRFTAFPIDGIMNLTYVDPATGQNATCDARCPLSDDPNVKFQDFRFVNVIGMNAFRLDILEWYGPGAGLNGIELFQDDIYAFAVNDFNEPACTDLGTPSNATTIGPWSVVASKPSSSEYLSGTFGDADVIGPSSASVRFTPNLRESGNYAVTIFTPGCVQDGTCATRGRVNITGVMATGTRATKPIQTEIYQTNDFDKYDQIYNGHVDLAGGAYRPTVTLTPSISPGDGNRTIVAQRVRFELLSTTVGLNGLYEFDPNRPIVDNDVGNSSFDRAGMSLSPGATVTHLVVHDDVSYVGGNFSTSTFENIFSFRGNDVASLPAGGLNAEVLSMHLDDRLLYVGGNFTNTSKTNTKGLNNVALYSILDRTWLPLGAGVNGRVDSIVPLSLNITNDKPETVIGLTGTFDQLLPFDDRPVVSVDGFAVWVTSKKDWLQNLDLAITSIDGQLTTFTVLPGGGPLLAGTLSSQGLGAGGAVSLTTSGSLSLNRIPIKMVPPSSSSHPAGGRDQRRAVSGSNLTGIVTGYFYEAGGRNVTILGGHFTVKASNGSNFDNLVFVNGSNADAVTGTGPGLSKDSVFRSVAVQQDTLYAGGKVSGAIDDANVNGLILYDLIRADYVRPQPPAFAGRDVVVNTIGVRPSTGDVYVGGNFDSAGSLGCPSVCIYTTSASQWNRPGDGISGSVGAMTWAGGDKLVVGGNLTINGNSTSMVTYDPNSRRWTAFAGVDDIPGPVTALSAADDGASRLWIAGASSNGSAFLMNYDGSKFRSVGDTLGKTTRIRGLQVLALTKNHQRNELLNDDQTLLVTGQLDLAGFGNASAALFDGITFTPFVLSTGANNSPGSVSQLVSLRRDFFKGGESHLAVGFVVLIALAIALALVFILVVVGIMVERIRRRREGYLPAPTQISDKNGNLERIPPSHLFGSIGQQSASRGPGGAPMI